MKDLFQYYPLTKDQYRELWEKCTFILDTNVLLNFYEYTDKTLEDFFKVLEKFKDRLWIPHQVALEYHKNPKSRIQTMNKRYEKINNDLDQIKRSIPEEEEGLKESFDNFYERLEKYQQSFLENSRLENVAQKIDGLFPVENIGEKPENQAELDAIYKEGEERYKKKVPPGFTDSGKPDSYDRFGLKFECKYGDLILWKQILKQVQNQSLSHIIFITFDNKEDWWKIEQRQTLEPRPELTKEILDAGASMFHMYKPEQFLKYALEYFDIEIQEESIQQVEEVSAMNNDSELSQPVKYEIGTLPLHKLLILGDNREKIIYPAFFKELVETYWNNIALVIPVVSLEDFYQDSYFDLINRGGTVDWLFAIVPNLNHPLDVDWIFVRPLQAHPWGYGEHPAKSNFNGGGSTYCFIEILRVIETLAKDDRVQNRYCYLPELYNVNSSKNLEFLYDFDLFRAARRLLNSSRPSFDNIYDKQRDIETTLCLGLYGCSETTLSMQWRVESLRSNKFWMSTTTELADQVTLALRLSGKSDCYTEVATSEAFEQWMGGDMGLDDYKYKRQPLLIRYADDVLFCEPPSLIPACYDAYFLDCVNQQLERLGRNGGDPEPTLRAWGINPQDDRFKFLFD
ncbi:PIN-like domain-containing protein [Limnoraphis robusta Tam1]|uniref:PIN-like domain-containing protein n=1 Tax=Limnoraphis robusta TaxID=1118279 RepID=UPI002B200DBE|nr:PIN-like domain-containing protein [Limnoraphis robusta]MEA5496333.1 PIN-like domain-containing protein [Limnoraphis robusta BA-68 BA1]MEA5538285.1 PIN-like domain-containing protein [Limnoraphis robusta Tam1]